MRILLPALLLLGGAALGDEIKLKNGDRITGTVTGLAGGKLAVDTPHAGAVKIDWARSNADIPVVMPCRASKLWVNGVAEGSR